MTTTKYSDDLWDLTEIPRATTIDSWFDQGVQVVIKRGGVAFCVYLGVPSDHPLAGFGYDSLPLDCHGGLTYAGEGNDDYLPKGYYFYGWDYGHAGDYTNFWGIENYPVFGDDKKWTLGEVRKDLVWNGLSDFKEVMELVERIVNKEKTK